jgi:translation elongation factor EF-1alpha
MPIIDKYQVRGIGCVLAGRIESGYISIGEKVTFTNGCEADIGSI